MGYFFHNKDEDRIDYSPGIFESFGNAIGGVMSGITDLISKGIMGFLILGCTGLILFLVGAFLLGRMGLIKADFNVTLASGVSGEGISIVTVSHQKKPRVVVTPAAAEGTTSFETSTRCQSVFLSYDGMLCDHGAYIIPGLFGDTNIECSLEPSRAVLVSFLDANGQKVIPESLEITDGASGIGCMPLGDGIFAFLLPEDAAGMTLTFQVPGYSPVTVTQDWNNYRLGELEVRLNG